MANSEPVGTLIGTGMCVDGDISFKGMLCVHGEIHGSIISQEGLNDECRLDPTGKVFGTVRVARVVVFGRIDGSVVSRQRIEVHKGGSITGDITYREIAIHSGGAVDGTLSLVATAEDGHATSEGSMHLVFPKVVPVG